MLIRRKATKRKYYLRGKTISNLSQGCLGCHASHSTKSLGPPSSDTLRYWRCKTSRKVQRHLRRMRCLMNLRWNMFNQTRYMKCKILTLKVVKPRVLHQISLIKAVSWQVKEVSCQHQMASCSNALTRCMVLKGYCLLSIRRPANMEEEAHKSQGMEMAV